MPGCLQSFRIKAPAAGGTAPTISATAWKGVAAATSKAVTVAPTAGHACVVVIFSYQTTSPTTTHAVTDNIDGATGWTKIFGTANSATNKVAASIWVKYSMASSVTSITGTAGAGTGAITVIVHEVTNITAFTGGETASSVFAATTNPQTGSVTNATANSIFFAVVSSGTGSNPCLFTRNQTGTTGGTWNLADGTNSQETNGSTNLTGCVLYLIQTASTASDHGWTISTDGNDGPVGIAAFH